MATNNGVDVQDGDVAAPNGFNLADIQAHGSKIASLAEGINGPTTFDIEKAAYGYIEGWQKLVVPEYVLNKCPDPANNRDALATTGGVDLSIIQVLHIALLNYVKLSKSSAAADPDKKLSENDVFWVAMYRARLIKQGYLYKTKEARSVTVDEVAVDKRNGDPHEVYTVAAEKTAWEAQVANMDTMNAAIEAYYTKITQPTAAGGARRSTAFSKFIELVTTRPQVLADVTFCAEQLAAMTYLVFRQFGHHFQDTLADKYDKMWRATTIAKPAMIPSDLTVHRTAIHSFGVRSLHIKFWQNFDSGKLAETFRDRSTVAPCGTAALMTAKACLDLMESLPIWSDIVMVYGQQIRAVRDEAAKLGTAFDSIKFHKNARLFGEQRHVVDLEVTTPIAPVIKGWLNFQAGTSDMSKQKALDKRASQNSMVVQLVESILSGVFTKIEKESNVSALVKVGSRKSAEASRPQIEDVGT